MHVATLRWSRCRHKLDGGDGQHANRRLAQPTRLGGGRARSAHALHVVLRTVHGVDEAVRRRQGEQRLQLDLSQRRKSLFTSIMIGLGAGE